MSQHFASADDVALMASTRPRALKKFENSAIKLGLDVNEDQTWNVKRQRAQII